MIRKSHDQSVKRKLYSDIEWQSEQQKAVGRHAKKKSLAELEDYEDSHTLVQNASGELTMAQNPSEGKINQETNRITC